MIPRLCAPFQHAELLPAIERRRGDHLEQMGLAHVIRAGAAQQNAAALEEAQGT